MFVCVVVCFCRWMVFAIAFVGFAGLVVLSTCVLVALVVVG